VNQSITWSTDQYPNPNQQLVANHTPKLCKMFRLRPLLHRHLIADPGMQTKQKKYYYYFKENMANRLSMVNLAYCSRYRIYYLELISKSLPLYHRVIQFSIRVSKLKSNKNSDQDSDARIHNF